MSGVMIAIIGFVVGRQIAGPLISTNIVTPNGDVVIGLDDEAGSNCVVGRYVDLLRNWLAVIAAAGLTQEERITAESLFASKIGYFGRADA
jgi:hypothetical protein